MAELIAFESMAPSHNVRVRPNRTTERRYEKFRVCGSPGGGRRGPNAGNNFEKVTSKTALVKAIDDALAYCDGAYGALTDATAAQTVPALGENGRRGQALRLSVLVQNFAHNNEHYGNIVTYMRIKSIVPPSSTAP